MSPEFGSQGAATSGGPDGRAAEKGLIQGFLASFGKFTSKIEDQLGEGNKVATRWSATGVHQGDFLGIPATGRTVTMTGTEIARFDENGKIAEIAVAFDMYGLLEQLR
jgi:predicted ester cyclase